MESWCTEMKQDKQCITRYHKTKDEQRIKGKQIYLWLVSCLPVTYSCNIEYLHAGNPVQPSTRSILKGYLSPWSAWVGKVASVTISWADEGSHHVAANTPRIYNTIVVFLIETPIGGRYTRYSLDFSHYLRGPIPTPPSAPHLTLVWLLSSVYLS